MSGPPRTASVAERYRGVRRHLRRRTARVAAAWSAVALAAVLLVAWWLAGPEGWVQGTPAPLALDLTLVGLLAVAAAVWVRLVRRWLTEPRLAGSMEEAAGLAPGTVRGSLELSRDLPPGVSAALAEHGSRGLASRLDLPPGRLAGRHGEATGRWSRRALAGLALLVPAVLAATVLAPERAARAWSGLAAPLRLAARPVLPPLAVEPGDVEVLRGGAVEVRVGAPLRERVTLGWQAAGDVRRERTAALPEGGGVARFPFPTVRAPIRYWAEAPDGAASDTFSITPVDPLLVSDVGLRLTFPPHTGRPPEEYRGDVPPLVVPVGTRIRVDGVASRGLSAAGLERRGESGGGPEDEAAGAAGPSVELQVDGAAFSGSWSPRVGGVWAWRFLDEDGAPAELAPRPLDLTLVADSAPEVRILEPARDTVLPATLRQLLVLQARDDYGLAHLELVAYRVSSLGERGEPLVQRVELGGSRGALARPLLDVSGWGLLPGDTVRVHARVADGGPGRQEARSREVALRMPGAAELRREAQRRLEEAAERVEEMADRAGRSAEETRDLERQATEERAPDERGAGRNRPEAADERAEFGEREDVRQALERQQELTGDVDSLRTELEALEEAMRDAGLSQDGLREDLRELQELLDELTTPELRERLERLAGELDDMNVQDARENLSELAEEQEAMRQRLEESIERFRRAAAEQDFRATRAEAEELAREERALADAMREGEDPELRAEQQARLEERAEEMEDRMGRLEQRLGELGEEEAAREVRDARQRSAEARAAMQEAQRRMRQQQGSQAGERADQAAEAMEEAARQLQEAQQQMAQEQAAAMQQALERAAEDALALARRQSEIREEMRGADGERMQQLRGDVGAVLQGLRNMAENLSVQMQASGGGDRELAGSMGQAMEALERSVAAMDARPGPSPSPVGAAEGAVEALNGVALRAMAGAQQMAQGGQGRSAEQLQEQLEQVAQQQGEVNNQTGQIMPMQLGQQAMQSQMQQLAQGQEAVAGQLGEMADQPGADGQSLGDLEALAEEAAALARELAGGRLDPETRQRQERLFHRLLDAGRSLEKEEESTERESEAAAAFERAAVEALTPEAVGALLYALPDADVLRRLSPAERQLVLRYFERLNRQGGRPAPPRDGGSDGGRR